MVHDLPFASVVQQQYVLMKSELKIIDHDADRAHNLPIRRRTPYLLEHTALNHPVIVNIQYMFSNVSEIQSKQYEPWIPMVHDLPFASVVQQQYVLMKSELKSIDHDGDQIHNLPNRMRKPYPLGHTT